MLRSLRPALVIAFVMAASGHAHAAVDAKWIWHPEGDPTKTAPKGKVWFRHEVRAFEPSTGLVRIACDDRFTLWVNGVKVGTGAPNQPYRFSLNGIVERGLNVIAIETENVEGRAGLFVDGEIRGQGGHAISIDSSDAWRSTTTPPQGNAWQQPRFDVSQWMPVRVLGTHDTSPWKAIVFSESYLDRYQLTPGFEIERIAEPELVGSLVAMTWGHKGRMLVSRERGPILNAIDSNGDGTFDKVTEFSSTVKNCQGLCVVGHSLYAVGDGPKGTGMYRLDDRDLDGKADETTLVTVYKGGMGEHGPHAVIHAPNGWLYQVVGNHAWITHPIAPTSANRRYYEGDLLRPRFEDPNGHAAGIPAPGGTIWRFTPDGKKWFLHTNGFRNAYDLSVNASGEIFTFDSDMEWEVGMPFYKPVRVTHCTGGAEFGWRSNAGKWPEYFFDSLPATADIGRGSPTGTIFYEHDHFPKPYHGAYLVADWSMGRILAVFLERDGASYKSRFETLISGNPLNVTDLDVDRDGTVIFSTGGRGTEGGLYRIRFVQGARRDATAKASTIDDLFALPQLQSTWAQEAVARIQSRHQADWATQLDQRARQGTPAQKIRALTLLAMFGPKPPVDLLTACSEDPDAAVRAFAVWLLGDSSGPKVAEALRKRLADPDRLVQRRACEAFVQAGIEPPVEPLLDRLASPDRFLRFAARLALERVPSAKWRDQALRHANPAVVSHALLALYRADATQFDPEAVLKICLGQLKNTSLDAERQLEFLRLAQLALLTKRDAPSAGALGQALLERFPNRDGRIHREIARITAFLQTPGVVASLLSALPQTPDHQTQIHLILCLSYVRSQWTRDATQQVFDWYETTRTWEGGHSFADYLVNIVGSALPSFEKEAVRRILVEWKERPLATRLLLRKLQPSMLPDYDEVLPALLASLEAAAERPERHELLGLCLEAIGRSRSEVAQSLLRKVYEEQPDRRELLARVLANYPTAANRPYYIRSLYFAERPAMQACLQALRRLASKPEKPDEYRAVILAGLKLGKQGGRQAVNLLARWTGSKPENEEDVEAALAHYQQWFRTTYPNEPSPELPKADPSKDVYTLAQLLDYLERHPRGQQGQPERGKEVFTKANCVKCHKFLNEGQGVGPDLTTVRRRFQKKEILEAILFPSQIVSDQYRSLTVSTAEGLLYTGLPLSPPGSAKLVLLLNDASKVEIPASEIEQSKPSTTSVMPDGLLKTLSLEDVADLMALFETGKSLPEPMGTAPGAPAAGKGR